MKRNAFTLLELTMVIVVLGIIAAMALPRLERDLRQEASANIVSALRYTQNLALTDNKTDPTDTNWQQELWHLRFSSAGGKWFYTISSNTDQGPNVDKLETAIDPLNGKYFYNLAGTYEIDADESPSIFISKKYGINSVTMGGACNAQHIAFDHLGRLHSNLGTATHLYQSYKQSDCTITLGFADTDIDDLVITVAAETGYITTN